MTQDFLKNLFFITVFNFILFPIAFSQSFPPAKFNLRVSPSNEYRNSIIKVPFAMVCYGLTSGQIVECSNEYLYNGLGAEEFTDDCTYNAEGLLIDNSCADGGHSHSDNRPKTYDDSQPIAYNGDDEDPSLFGVFGIHISDGVSLAEPIITVNMPSAAGVYSWHGVLRLETMGWEFFSFQDGVSEDQTEVLYVGTTQVGVHGLRQLPDSSHYIKVRSPDSSHVDEVAFAGTELMIEAITVLAKEYNLLSEDLNYILSVNDMSLPMGGVFDLHDNWTRPHSSHRFGTDADLNKQPGNATAPIPCMEDRFLHRASIKNLAPFNEKRKSAILCELNNNNNKHLDLTRILQ